MAESEETALNRRGRGTVKGNGTIEITVFISKHTNMSWARQRSVEWAIPSQQSDRVCDDHGTVHGGGKYLKD